MITSIRLAEPKGELLLVASTQTTQKSGCSTRIQVNIPMLDAYFTGTGKPLCWLDNMSQQHSIVPMSSFALGCIDLPMLSIAIVGDLLTALLLARLHKDPDNMQYAVEQAVASLQAVLLASARASGEAAHATERTAEVWKRWHVCAML